MTLDPETIAILISYLLPHIEDCLAKRQTRRAIVEIVRNPNAAQRRRFLRRLPKSERTKLETYWQCADNRKLTKRFANRMVTLAKRAA